jgi:signal peptide peptidase SppA
MRFQRIIEQVYYRPWYITPAAHASIHRIVSARLLGRRAEDDRDDGFDISELYTLRAPLSIGADGIAVISILGPLGKGLSQMEKNCGCTGFEDVRADYEAALAGGAKGILLRIDSPGGTVMGTPELAALIASRQLPTVVYTEDVMASAAYYLAAGANVIVASTSAAVGSIGVYIPWIDYADSMKREGLTPNPVVNEGGDLKALGFTGVLTESQRAYLQAEVNESFSQFKGHVRAFRDVADDAMRGQVMDGSKALAENLIDEIGDERAARARLLALIG